LCEFTAKRGNLDMRFTPSPSAIEGMAGHRTIASRRGTSFQTELTLSGDYGLLRVRGRADGYDPDANRLEEFKTYRGDLNRMPENHRALHWAQLRIYGWLLCKQKNLDRVKLALVYFDVGSERETIFEEEQSAGELEQHFAEHCQSFVSWAESETAHRQVRDESLRDLRFPFADFHGGQRELSRAVYKRIRTGGALLAQAPTGIGKTVGTLFPALKAMGTPTTAPRLSTAQDSGNASALRAGTAPDTGAASSQRVGTAPDTVAASSPRAGTVPDTGAASSQRVGTAPDTVAASSQRAGTVPDTGAASSQRVGTAPDTAAASSQRVGTVPDTGAASSQRVGTAPDTGAASSQRAGTVPDTAAASSQRVGTAPESAPLDKVFYLVAKTSQRKLALDALRLFQPENATLPLRVLELVARGKSCENPGMPCDGAVCPLARGFYDRLPAARAEAMGVAFLNQEATRQVALRHQICPYYLGQELARWSDVVVGDYNYYFDRSAMLFGWTITHEWRVCLLVDEAHNLVERARTMYTSTLDFEALNAVQHILPGAFDPLRRVWTEINAAQENAHQIYDEPPEALLIALNKLISILVDYLSTHAGQNEALQEFFFAALGFARLAADYDSSTLFEITRAGRNQSQMCLRNLVPGRFLAPRFSGAQASVLFSATLAPHEFFRDILGLPQTCAYLDVQSPFLPEQLAVRLVRSISTRFKDRARSLAPIADLLAQQYETQPGNYLVFLSSFEYLDSVASLVAARHPQIPTWHQRAGMTEPERDAFLSRFVPDGAGVGFAVLGGAFAEGVDLPGSRLIGAFVATLGLPQVNAVNEEMQRRMESRFGSGYEYTYLYPGIQKVVQAAGRVIRTTTDRGVLYLIDDRFTHSRVRKLLPQWWNVDPLLSPRPSSTV
jgi:DNA excision repair protein ERCC-2